MSTIISGNTPSSFGDDVSAPNLILPTAPVVGYQRGLWTPTIPNLQSFSTSADRNVWSRSGDLVTVAGFVSSMASDGTGNAVVGIASLPYNPNTNSVGGSCMTRFCGIQAHACYMDGGLNVIQFFESSTAAWETVTKGRVFSAGNQGQIFFSTTYLTDDTTWTPINGATVS